jgi:hypothetical protein
VPYNGKSLGNLRPAWKPGQSSNPQGKAPGTYGYWRRLAAELAETKGALAKESMPAVEKAKPMERIACAVCRHAERVVIDGLLTLGIPLRPIARRYRFSKSSLHRHKRRHLPVFPNAERAMQIQPIDEGLNQILNSWDGMRLSGPVDGAQRAIERLWKLNHATAIKNDPLDRLRILTIEALVYLIPILWRDRRWSLDTRESNMKDYEAAIKVLKSWGRDTGSKKAG